MGKKTKKRPRWRKMSLDDGEDRRSPSPGHSEGGGGMTAQRDKFRPRSRNSFSRSHSVTTYVFDEDEYTKIQTPRQDMIFKKSAFTRRRPPADGSLSEEAETLSVGAGSESAQPPCERPAGGPPAADQASSATPELSEVSSEGKPASECGEGSEPRDPLAALASQIQYAFIDPQGNVYFNVMDESGIIHLPPVAGYYMAPSYPGGPVVATPVPWQAVPIAPLDSPEYQALMRRQAQQQQAQQQAQMAQQGQMPQGQMNAEFQQNGQFVQQGCQQHPCQQHPCDQQQCPEPAYHQQACQQQACQQSYQQEQQQELQHQQEQDLTCGESCSLPGSRSRSELSDDATSATGSRPISPVVPDRHNSSGPEHDFAEQEQQTSPGDEGKTRRLKKKKKKQKKKTNSVDSGVTDDGSDGCREPPPTPDCVAICSDSSASGGRVRNDHHLTSGRPASDQTSSGVQSDVSLPDSPQRRPSGDRGHGTGAAAADAVSRDGQLLHSAATALSRQLDTKLKMQPSLAEPEMTAQVAAQVTAQVNAQPASSQPESQSKNEPVAVSALEAAILSHAQLADNSALQDASADVADIVDGREVMDAAGNDNDDDDASEGESPEREVVDDGDDAESCDSFVYEDKSLGEPAASSPPPSGDFLDTGAAPQETEDCVDVAPVEVETSRKSSNASQASQVSEVVPEFEEEPVPARSFTDLSIPVDLRRTVILEETESERDRESSPGSVSSLEAGRLSKDVSEERQLRASEERLDENSGKLRQQALVEEPVLLAKAAIEVCAVPEVSVPSKEQSLIESQVKAPSLEDDVLPQAVVTCSAEASLPKDTTKSSVLPSDPTAEPCKEAPTALPSASKVSDSQKAVVSETTAEPNVSLQPHLTAAAPDPAPPPDGSPPSPPSSLSDRSISSAVRGWLKDQSPEAVFVVADDEGSEFDDDEDGDWESDEEAAAVSTTTPAAPPKNAQGNPSPVPRSSVRSGERVANRRSAQAARLHHPAAYYSLGVALDEPESPPAVLQLVDLDGRSVLTVPLDGPAAAPGVTGGDSDGSEELDTGALAAPAPAAPPRASLAQELLQVGSLHRASDRQLIGDSALFSASAVGAPAPASKALVCPEAGAAEAEEADEGYGGSPLASPEARPRVRGLPPHPLHHLGAEAPAPWGVCCSLQ